MNWYKQLHWQIMSGLLLGLLFGLFSVAFGWKDFSQDWISPFGAVFIKLLKLSAMPLILGSLITGVASLSNIKRFSHIGGKTISIYLSTTVISTIIGLFVVNAVQPGQALSSEIQEHIMGTYKPALEEKEPSVNSVKNKGPLQPLVDMIPSNFFGAASSNRNMLQIVFFAILMGLGLIRLEKSQSQPLKDFFYSLNALMISIVRLIMMVAPYGVFALIVQTMNSVAGSDTGQAVELLRALGIYCLTAIVGFSCQVFFVYPLMLKLFTPMKLKTFFKGIAPVQLLAFSTSSSGATLPFTMEKCEKDLGVSEEVSAFSLPLGASINMDGTSLYLAVASVFISQALGIPLDFQAQVSLVFAALLASIGTASVPGASIVMLIIILESVGLPSEGIALILGVDRILDMLRTVVNVTGDATTATIVASGDGSLKVPKTK